VYSVCAPHLKSLCFSSTHIRRSYHIVYMEAGNNDVDSKLCVVGALACKYVSTCKHVSTCTHVSTCMHVVRSAYTTLVYFESDSGHEHDHPCLSTNGVVEGCRHSLLMEDYHEVAERNVPVVATKDDRTCAISNSESVIDLYRIQHDAGTVATG